jgi:hypothetical protein
MTKKLLSATTILLATALLAFGADISGRWTFQQPGFNGGDPIPITITLKADGSTLTGTVPPMMGGRGGRAQSSEITNGKVDGDKFYFEVKRPGRGGGEQITKYEGTFSGDDMKLKITRPGRGGGPMVIDVPAKREKS